MVSRVKQTLTGLALMLYVALSFLIAHTGATLAVLTDTSSASNTFSLAVYTSDTIYWAIDESGAMIIAPSASLAQAGRTIAEGKSGSFERDKAHNWDAWYSSITSVRCVGKVKPLSMKNWFYDYYGYTALTTVDLSGLDASEVTSMEALFGNCQNLTSVTFGALDARNVTSMKWMFSYCYKLENLDLSSVVTSTKLTSLEQMFYQCYKLPSVSFEGFTTSQVTTFSNMFYQCSALRSIDLSTFDTNKASDMHDMFTGCSALELLITGTQWREKSSWLIRAAAIPRAMYEADGTQRKSGWSITNGAHTLTSTYPATRVTTAANRSIDSDKASLLETEVLQLTSVNTESESQEATSISADQLSVPEGTLDEFMDVPSSDDAQQEIYEATDTNL